MLLQPQGAVATAAPPSTNVQDQTDFAFLLECIESTSHLVGQMWGEGGAAVAETALQTFNPSQTEGSATLIRKVRGKGLSICPEHHLLVFDTKEAFKKHIRLHGNEFRCSQPGCKSEGHIFTTLNRLHTHVRRVHGAELVGKESSYFQCGHCEEPSTLRKVTMLYHLKVRHLTRSERRKIRSLGEVEHYCLPPEDPSNFQMRTFTLAPRFLKKVKTLPPI